jgi:hypothetical protein
MNKIIYSLFIVCIVLGCSKQHVVENTMVDTATTLPGNELSDSIDYETDGWLQRDSLLVKWYKHLIDVTNDTNLNFSSEKKHELNKFVAGQMDTIERLTFKESYILIYRTRDKNILLSSDIQNSEISLSKRIKVGISRDELLKELNAQSNRDTLTVTDFEGNTNVTLILKNNLLTHIIYAGYID